MIVETLLWILGGVVAAISGYIAGRTNSNRLLPPGPNVGISSVGFTLQLPYPMSQLGCYVNLRVAAGRARGISEYTGRSGGLQSRPRLLSLHWLLTLKMAVRKPLRRKTS